MREKDAWLEEQLQDDNLVVLIDETQYKFSHLAESRESHKDAGK